MDTKMCHTCVLAKKNSSKRCEHIHEPNDNVTRYANFTTGQTGRPTIEVHLFCTLRKRCGLYALFLSPQRAKVVASPQKVPERTQVSGHLCTACLAFFLVLGITARFIYMLCLSYQYDDMASPCLRCLLQTMYQVPVFMCRIFVTTERTRNSLGLMESARTLVVVLDVGGLKNVLL